MVRRVLLVVFGWAAALALASAPATADAPQTPVRSPAAATLSQCLQSGDRLSVLVLVDQSGSLDTTDPANLRVGGLGAALMGLKRLSEKLGAKREVEVLLAGFYYRVDTYPAGQSPPRWTPLDDGTLDRLLGEVGRFAERARHKGRDTDYAAALMRARDLFAQRSQELARTGEQTCKALVWFTDGKYQVRDRLRGDPAAVGLPRTTPYAPGVRLDRLGGGARVEAVGRAVLCDRGGLMDDLARAGVVKFTVALSKAFATGDEALLQRLTTGGRACGSLLSERTGQYFDATEGTQLLFELASVAGPRLPVHAPPLCEGQPCPQGTTSFTLVDGLARFVMTADTGAEGVEAILMDPKGRPVRLRGGGPKRLAHGGAQLTQRWLSKRQLVLEAVLPAADAAWRGTWRIAFVKPPSDEPDLTAHYTLQLVADVVPQLVDKPALTRGSPGRVRFRLSRRGAPGINPLVRQARVAAWISEQPGATGRTLTVSGPDERGAFTADVPPLENTSQTVYLDLVVDFQEASGIAPIAESLSLTVRPPNGYPRVAPQRLDLASIAGAGATTGTITLAGSASGGGCAWVAAPQTSAPTDAGSVALSVTPAARTPESCLKVAAGQRKQLRVTYRPASPATGAVRSELPIHLRSEVNDGDELVTMPVSFDVYRRAVESDILRTAILTLLGAIPPLLVLHLLNLWSARFPPSHRIKILTQDVTWEPAAARLTADGGDPVTDYASFDWPSDESSARKRSLDAGPLELRAVASGSLRDRRLRLFRGPYGVVTSGGRSVVAGAAAPVTALRSGQAHEVPLALAGTWVFVVEDLRYGDRETDVAKVDGQLVLMIASDGDIDQGQRLVGEARRGLQLHEWPAAPEADPTPGRLARMRTAVVRQRVGDDVNGSWLDDRRPDETPHPTEDNDPSRRAPATDEPDGSAGLRY